jgi:hypothetical protein
MTKLKHWVLPPTVDKRKQRMSEYKDFAIFMGSIAVISYFQDTISKALEIDVDSLKNA